MSETVAAWVSVKDRLPSKEGFYLVYCPDERELPVHAEWFFPDLRGGSFDPPYLWGDTVVTHWAPLPAPPR